MDRNDFNMMVKDMEYLINELQKEWSVSKEIRHSINITKERAHEFRTKAARWIMEYDEFFKANTETPFAEIMEYCKDSYVLLRFEQKMAKALETSGKTVGSKITLSLDKEEFKVYRRLSD